MIKVVTALSTPVPSTSAPRKKQSDPISFKNRKKQKPRVTSSDLQTLMRSDSYINDSIIEAGLFELTKKTQIGVTLAHIYIPRSIPKEILASL